MSQFPPSPILVTIPAALQLVQIGRSYLYELLGDGTIRSVKAGKRRLVDVSSLRSWAAGLCQGRSKTRPVGRSKSRPVVGSKVVEYSGEEGRWSVAEAALLPRVAFGGVEFSVRRKRFVCGGSA
jgi:excisionase family DNA binding protein